MGSGSREVRGAEKNALNTQTSKTFKRRRSVNITHHRDAALGLVRQVVDLDVAPTATANFAYG